MPAAPVIRPTGLQGVHAVYPTPIRDHRGFFVRTLSLDVFLAAGIDPRSFVQENQSRSRRGTLRGLHMRKSLSEAKLVRCARGRIWEVVVDLRPWSVTFRQWRQFVLDDVDHVQLLVPAGCAHGFLVLSEEADVCYKHDAYYEPDLEAALAWDDPELAIPWPLPDPVLSERDRTAPRLAELCAELGTWYGHAPPAHGDTE